jgi:hypothetical protein
VIEVRGYSSLNVCGCVSIRCVFKVSNLAAFRTLPSIGYDCVEHVGMQQTVSRHMTNFSFHLD